MSDDPEESDMLLNAYFDGELDAVSAKRFEARLAAEPDLAAGLLRLKQLRGRLRADIAEDLPPAALRRRIAARFAAPAWLPFGGGSEQTKGSNCAGQRQRLSRDPGYDPHPA